MAFPRHEEAAAATMAGMDMSGMDMSGMDMGGMDMGSGSGMSMTNSASNTMMTMMVAFQNDFDTPLYTMAWTPKSIAGYAATCIFLIGLAAILRGLFALKTIQESRWLDQEMNRRFVVVNGQLPMHENLSQENLKQNMVLSSNGVEEQVMVVKKKHTDARPWRASVDPVRAVIDTIIAGVGYMLMLAVMTMNIGYFLSILGGTFLGSLLVGRFAIMAGH